MIYKDYYRDKCGALVQKGEITAIYDKQYVESRYDAYPTTRAMSKLRWGVINRQFGWRKFHGRSACDFGCGNGDFILFGSNKCGSWLGNAYGIEASDYPLPEPIQRISEPIPCDLFTCFDSLEHLKDPRELLAKVDSPYICISLPWCHERTLGADWFRDWKHRRPGEHIWHFDHISLPALLSEFGYKLIYCGNPEDEIRKGNGKLPNILTCLFQKA